MLVIGGGNSALEEGLHLSEFAAAGAGARPIRSLRLAGSSRAGAVRSSVRHSHRRGHRRTRGRAGQILRRRGPRRATAARPIGSPPAAAFVFIGLQPNNAFLGNAVERDAGGFLVTSPTMETSMAGVFAAGDVRSGSTKQLGSAVGDGIAALLMTRRYLEAHHHKAVARVDA